MGFEKMAEDIIDQQNKLFPHLEDLRHHEEMPQSLKRAMDAVRGQIKLKLMMKRRLLMPNRLKSLLWN